MSLPGPYAWATNLNVGTVQVTGLGIATNPTNLWFSISGSTLTLSWPAEA